MVVMYRGDFINCLKSGNAKVLGTCTGCAGMLHNQGTTNGMYIRGNTKRFTLAVTVKAEIENLKLGANWKTYIKQYIPKMRYEMEDEEKSSIAEDANFERIFINTKNTKISYEIEEANEDNGLDYDNEYIVIDDGKNKVKRCIKNTTYGNEDKSYRTTYYFGGNTKVDGVNYGYVVEGIEFNIEDKYIPSLFVVYIIEGSVIRLHNNSGLGASKKEELEKLEEELNGKKKKKKNSKYRDSEDDEEDEY